MTRLLTMVNGRPDATVGGAVVLVAARGAASHGEAWEAVAWATRKLS
jgi:hypothetical protein